MSRFINFYYGMSGAFKGTTIKSKLGMGDDVLWSGIKYWKSLEDKIDRYNNPNHLNLALLHLSRMNDKLFDISKDGTTLHIERGITDMLFYWLNSVPVVNSETVINNLVEEELRVSGFIAGDIDKPVIRKILLIQQDYGFVENVVFKEFSRSSCFPGGIRDYINAQDRYISFTKKYNKIDEEIYIPNAKEYLSGLGISFNPGEEIN